MQRVHAWIDARVREENRQIAVFISSQSPSAYSVAERRYSVPLLNVELHGGQSLPGEPGLRDHVARDAAFATSAAALRGLTGAGLSSSFIRLRTNIRSTVS